MNDPFHTSPDASTDIDASLAISIYNRTTNTPSVRHTPSFNPNILRLLRKRRYIDKTKHLMLFMVSQIPIIVLRPRRFGKTLTINTIAAIAEGHVHKELFKDTSIYKDYLKDEEGRFIDNEGDVIEPNLKGDIIPEKYTWVKYPVFKISFIDILEKGNIKLTEKNLLDRIYETVEKYNLSDMFELRNKAESVSSYMSTLFRLLKTLDEYQDEIIVLIDEYDCVFHDYNYENNEDEKKEHVAIFMKFYKALKRLNDDDYIKFVYITGITNLFFTKEISPLTGWDDYSFEPITAELVGFTKSDILSFYPDQSFKLIYANHFGCDIDNITESIGEIKEKVMQALIKMYDGYQFTTKKVHVFNSESIVFCFKKFKIANYWNRSLNTEFQWQSILKTPEIFARLINTERFSNINMGILIGNNSSLINDYDKGIAAAYQTGLLTIKNYNQSNQTFDLKIPNEEVRENFNEAVRQAIEFALKREVDKGKTLFIDSMENDNWKTFFNFLRRAIGNVINRYTKHEINEAYFTVLMAIMFQAFGITQAKNENKVSGGAITDIHFTYKGKLYIFENKFCDEGYHAIKRDKGFCQIIHKYYSNIGREKLDGGMEVYAIGLNFQKLVDTEGLSLIRINNKIMRCYGFSNSNDSDKIKQEGGKSELADKKSIEHSKGRLEYHMYTSNNLDSFYMKKFDTRNDRKIISHLEGRAGRDGIFEVTNVDSCPGNLCLFNFDGYTYDSDGLI